MNRISIIINIISLFLYMNFGCKSKAVEYRFSEYMISEFGHKVEGDYIALDINGCGSCTQQLLNDLQADENSRDSIILVLIGGPKEVDYYAEVFENYRLYGDSTRAIYRYMEGIENFRLPLKLAYPYYFVD